MIKDRNSNDLPEAEEIKKRYQECTKELFKKGLNDWDNQDGVVNLEPDILEYEIKRALGSITMNKTNGSDRILAELFQILEDDAIKILHSKYQQIWKVSSGLRIGKGQFSSQSQRKAMPGNVQTITQLCLFHMLAK